MFVKICGVTSEEDALLAVAMGADAVGFNFVAGSVRQIAAQKVADIVKRLPREILTVGVFRDHARSQVVDITHGAGLQAAQLHGGESAQDCRWVADRVGKLIKTFPAGARALTQAVDYGADWALVDNDVGGSGQTFDWSLVADVDPGVPLILAGGLTPENVGDAVRAVRPWGVDVATGVESAPGRKDARLMAAFVDAAVEALQSESSELEAAESPDPAT